MMSIATLDRVNQCPTPLDATLRRLDDRQYLAMELAYARHGGLVEGNDVARRLRRRSSQPISLLAHWIVERNIVSFHWRGRLLVPDFQFEAPEMMPRPEVARILSELTPFLDDWDVALWFSRPNAWIDDQSPIDVIASNPNAVLQAARADRYIAKW
jgi:hypothetical protein